MTFWVDFIPKITSELCFYTIFYIIFSRCPEFINVISFYLLDLKSKEDGVEGKQKASFSRYANIKSKYESHL